MKKVVCLGGGNAMPSVVLKELKNEDIDLSVISAVLDSGGSSGKLREDFDIIAVGDLRRSLIQLSLLEDEIKEVFNYRFEEGDLKGHNLGNLVIASILIKEKNPVLFLNNFFKTKFNVFPATLETADLCAELEDGEIIKGETNIDLPKHDSQIKKVFLNKEVHAFKKATEKLEEADYVIIGPGDLYSSLIQILLVSGISEAIQKSKAKIIYICNSKNKKGETNDFMVDDFEKEIEKYLGKKIDYTIFNNTKGIDLVGFSQYNDSKHIGMDLQSIHNSKKLVNQLMKLI